jgi:uncharacterized protein GlcG (DUF336 family)
MRTLRHRAGALGRAIGIAVAVAVVTLLLASPAAAQMPDLSQMNGLSLPAPDAPAGSATVRVMRQTLGNNVVGQEVTLTDANGATVATRKTDDAGRAAFDGLRPGSAYTAVAVVSGERLVSQPFTQPPSGGVRVVLVAGLVPAPGGAAAGGAAPGMDAPAAASAGPQMPPLSQMNGRSLPAPDAPAGSATVRVMRQTLGNNVVGQEVTLTDAGGATVATRTTDDGGRATFEGLRPGTAYTAVAVVSGERLVSQPFTQPPSGGVRVVLVAGLGTAGPPAPGAAPAIAAKPAPPGSIVLGTQTRMIVEHADEFVEVFVLADLVNTTDGPVSLPSPIVFTPPTDALGTAVLEGSTAAALDGGRIVVKGPLPSGPTSIQFGYRLPSDTGRVSIAQAYPVGGPMSSVIVRKQDATTITVGGERQRRDTQLEGRDYVIVTTAAIQPTTPIDVTITGLPARSRWPLRVALSLAALIVLAGVVFGRARADDDGTAPAPARS